MIALFDNKTQPPSIGCVEFWVDCEDLFLWTFRADNAESMIIEHPEGGLSHASRTRATSWSHPFLIFSFFLRPLSDIYIE